MTGTSGEPEGITGAVGRWRPDRQDRLGLLTITAATLVFCIVNALTVTDDLTNAGAAVASWKPWVWELTSAAFWILIALPLLRLLRRWRPPNAGFPAAIAAVVVISIPVCALHLLFLAASRAALYALFGDGYSFDWGATQIIYEWRKDIVSVAIFAVLGFVIDRLTTVPRSVPGFEPALFRLEVKDAACTRWLLPAEIERVEAAGNYVELHTAFGPILHRATLAAVGEQLADHGFSRIHRSRLIRRDAVVAITTTAAGDFEATLEGGARVGGSRRFRSNLDSKMRQA